MKYMGGIKSEVYETEGIKYAGSKLKLIPYIIDIAHKVDASTVFDGFSGSTRVSQAFARAGYTVIANDISAWSEVFGKCYLKSKKSKDHYKRIIDHLNNVSPVDGWYTENYGGYPDKRSSTQKDGLKKPWQIHNTRKLDAVREEIEMMGLDETEKAVAITSLILALDQVDSTIGHYSSYLYGWSPRSYNHMVLKVPKIVYSEKDHSIYRENIFNLTNSIEADIAYYDPPYGSNNEKMPSSRVRYAAYYHIWTTVCLNDKPKLFGKVKRRTDSSDKVAISTFEEYRRDTNGRFIATNAIEKLIKETKSKYIIMSYSSGGRATAEEINGIINTYGKIIEVVEVDYKKNVMAGMTWTNEWLNEVDNPNIEFVFLIQK